ncbi:restriction endonuclease subunit S [Clostridium perfringens]|uniref:restriction endonuclease subunit S n=1 Tax=Clostridium perfringens TaxID=1502 RepID=UPI0013D73AEA|nr:restriction endonuclease subunit S [Clostridium perfringens]
MGKKVREGYKKTDFGEIPIEWTVKKFRDIFERIVEKNKNNISDNVLTISAQNGLINQEKFFNKSVASKNTSNYFLLKKGDFAYNKSYSSGYPMGAIKRLNSYNKGIVSPLYICFRIKDENINSDFYEQFFEYDLFDKAISGIAQEGARNHGLLNVAVNEFFDLPIIVPTKEEQKKIAEILSTVDKQIENTEKLIQKNQELKKGLMQQLLTKGIGHTEFKKTELGNIPKEWEVKKLGEIFKLSSGSFLSQKNIIEGDYPVYGGNGISGYHNDYLFDESKLIIGRVGAKCGCIHISNYKSWITDNALYISEKIIDFDNKFMYYLLKYKDLNKYANQNAQPVISGKKIYSINVAMPQYYEQVKIASILLDIDKKIKGYKVRNEKLEELKRGLMQQLLTGKIRVI